MTFNGYNGTFNFVDMTVINNSPFYLFKNEDDVRVVTDVNYNVICETPSGFRACREKLQ